MHMCAHTNIHTVHRHIFGTADIQTRLWIIYYSLLKIDRTYDSDPSIMPLQFPTLNNMERSILNVSSPRDAQNTKLCHGSIQHYVLQKMHFELLQLNLTITKPKGLVNFSSEYKNCLYTLSLFVNTMLHSKFSNVDNICTVQ
jgi:hypothetical protein